jgi:RimJ/RimL family protein N-acetyltransferase
MPAATIETPRLLLRGWRDADVESWAEMNADPRVMEFFPRTYDRARAEAMACEIRTQLERNGYGWWIVEIKESGRFAGVICIDDVGYEVPFAPPREVGWRLAFDAWDHGYATEGAAAALDFAFHTLGWDEVVAMTAALNIRSQRVMERLGMKRDLAGDFEHPRIEEGHRLRRHVLYRIRKG